MQSRRNFLPVFVVFLILSVCILFLSRITFFSFLGILSNPLFSLDSVVFHFVTFPTHMFSSSADQQVREENISLQNKVASMQKLQEDNTALRDQFATTSIRASNLLPATVIGDPQFLPGVTAPESLVLGSGESDGIKKGDVVVYKDNLIGIISQVSTHASLVVLVSNTATSFTARDLTSGAQGVLTGEGNGRMILGNVVLSDVLHVGDLVVTNGLQNVAGKGLPPGLVIGKIVSVEKKPSSLYQSASVESLLQMQRLTTIFILKQ